MSDQTLTTAIVRFRLRPGISREEAMADIRHTVPLYQAQPALVRKQISLDLAGGTGTSVYLWTERAPAERFFEMARRVIAEQTGHEPEVELLDTQVVVDNRAGEVTFV